MAFAESLTGGVLTVMDLKEVGMTVWGGRIQCVSGAILREEP